MAAIETILAKLAATAASNEKVRKGIGWVIVAALAPFILLAAFLCSLGTGAADHNNVAVQACFYGTAIEDSVPLEFRTHIANMKDAFTRLDAAVAEANAAAGEAGGLDPTRVKAIFYALCFGEDAPNRREARQFVQCFYEETDGVVTPISLDAAYANLSALLGREITQEDKDNAAHIYTMVAGSVLGQTVEGGSYTGGVEYGSDFSNEIDVSVLRDPDTKNADDLVAYAIRAWQCGWGYVWGTFGGVLTEDAFASKLAQYPEALTTQADFIRSTWVGRRTTDCVGLIKSYGWLDAETATILYNTNGMPDISANEMYHRAAESGDIGTIPEIPGIAVWHDGHIGVYVGGGYVIEAMGTRYGVVRTELEGRGWTHWLKIPYIEYDSEETR